MVVKKMMMVIMVLMMLTIKQTMTDDNDLDLLIKVVVVAFRSKQKSVCDWVLRMASPDTAPHFNRIYDAGSGSFTVFGG
ncbi:hypothetical protein DPMN_033025 [Dreissena polymorpha]|uniref:Secreted protein n=1 Tax=Dreissena polymorpha TaxID=45954 RepID=A0A9D4M511_DREPO|nr:hypothetical protein DPMN_033025 [Dreissena polymorpha]